MPPYCHRIATILPPYCHHTLPWDWTRIAERPCAPLRRASGRRQADDCSRAASGLHAGRGSAPRCPPAEQICSRSLLQGCFRAPRQLRIPPGGRFSQSWPVFPSGAGSGWREGWRAKPPTPFPTSQFFAARYSDPIAIPQWNLLVPMCLYIYIRRIALLPESCQRAAGQLPERAYPPGYARIHQDTPGYTGIHQDTPGYTRVQQGTPGYARVRRDTCTYVRPPGGSSPPGGTSKSGGQR